MTIQDHAITAAMGGVLPEQPDATVFQQVLDIGCGSGSWAIEIAQAYPAMSLLGIDISQRMVDYAREQASSQQVADRVEFLAMNALLKLELLNDSFDLVNLLLGSSFLRTWDWPNVLSEMQRVIRRGGVLKVTECELGVESAGPAVQQFFEMSRCAAYRSGHLFTQERSGMTSHLTRLLRQYAVRQVQTQAYTIENRVGTEEGQAFYDDLRYGFQTIRPFVQKWGCIQEDYDAIYKQALIEMRQPDFLALTFLLTAWGNKTWFFNPELAASII
ncbi:MAG: methyltransferase domain-containing protein [Ktedonobacteraceae bacterium]